MSERDKELLGNVSVVFHAAGPCNETFRFSKQLSRIQVVAVVTSIFERASDDRVVEAGKEGHDGPMALVRVPLVGPALREPMPGFVDTLKGSTALIAGAGHVLGNSNLQAEIIPIDLAVNTLITVAWERATSWVPFPCSILSLLVALFRWNAIFGNVIKTKKGYEMFGRNFLLFLSCSNFSLCEHRLKKDVKLG